MSQPAEPHDTEVKPPSATTQSGGVNVSGGRVEAGHDIAGRDIYEGFSPSAVQRLVLSVGALVFLATMCSAVCFFTSGFVIANQVNAFSRPIESTIPAARSMQNKLALMAQLRRGESAVLTFSETELSSYVRFVMGPPNGLSDARVRMSDTPRELALTGNYDALDGTPVLATFRMTTGDEPLELETTAIKAFGDVESALGWIVVPNALVATTVNNVIDPVFSQVRFADIRESRAAERSWTLIVVKQ